MKRRKFLTILGLVPVASAIPAVAKRGETSSAMTIDEFAFYPRNGSYARAKPTAKGGGMSKMTSRVYDPDFTLEEVISQQMGARMRSMLEASNGCIRRRCS